MPPDPTQPRPIELPSCAYCPEYASETIPVAPGYVLYVCDEHYAAWLAMQEDED